VFLLPLFSSDSKINAIQAQVKKNSLLPGWKQAEVFKTGNTTSQI